MPFMILFSDAALKIIILVGIFAALFGGIAGFELSIRSDKTTADAKLTASAANRQAGEAHRRAGEANERAAQANERAIALDVKANSLALQLREAKTFSTQRSISISEAKYFKELINECNGNVIIQLASDADQESRTFSF